jgi:large subunit ribosomal protein L15
MKLHTLPKITTRKSKRLGHGYGSGKGGHTSSRGQKGQKSRNGVRMSFTGSSWVWFKRLPFMRGKSRFNSFAADKILTLSQLNVLKSGSVVTKESLLKAGLLTKSEAGSASVKIVGNGELKVKLVVSVLASASAQKAIIKTGGEYRGESVN